MNSEDTDETVAIMWRYARAAQEGTARLNLRLLAAAYAGQGQPIVADEFLYYADMITSLKREEIIPLGKMMRHLAEISRKGFYDVRDMNIAVLREMEKTALSDPQEFWTLAGALLRTGLVALEPRGGAIGSSVTISYRPIVLLEKLNTLIDIEGVIERSELRINQ